MHKIDKNILVGVIALSAMGYSFMAMRKAQNKPVNLLGLNDDNSIKIVGGIGVLAAAALIFGLFKKHESA